MDSQQTIRMSDIPSQGEITSSSLSSIRVVTAGGAILESANQNNRNGMSPFPLNHVLTTAKTWMSCIG